MDTQTLSLVATLIGTPALCALVVVVGGRWLLRAMADFKRLQRQPPIAEEIARDYAKKSDLSSLRDEWQRHCAAQHAQVTATLGEIFTLVRQSDRRNAETFREVARMIGLLEGKMFSRLRPGGDK